MTSADSSVDLKKRSVSPGRSEASAASIASASDGGEGTNDSILNGDWLMKRSRFIGRWRKQWFILKQSDLYYGDSPETAVKRIVLQHAEIAESSIDRKQFAFRISPQNSRRVHYMCALDQNKQNDWMERIFFAKAAGQEGETSQACIIQ